MKEVVRFIGGGFIALVLASGFFVIYRGFVGQWRFLETVVQKEVDGPEMEQNYGYSIKKHNLSVTFSPNKSLITNQVYLLEDYIRIMDGNGEVVHGRIQRVVKVSDGSEMEITDAKIAFDDAGVYEVYVRCYEEEFVLQIPVNVGGI